MLWGLGAAGCRLGAASLRPGPCGEPEVLEGNPGLRQEKGRRAVGGMPTVTHPHPPPGWPLGSARLCQGVSAPHEDPAPD